VGNPSRTERRRGAVLSPRSRASRKPTCASNARCRSPSVTSPVGARHPVRFAPGFTISPSRDSLYPTLRARRSWKRRGAFSTICAYRYVITLIDRPHFGSMSTNGRLSRRGWLSSAARGISGRNMMAAGCTADTAAQSLLRRIIALLCERDS
jgi:hypothetical protein